MQDWSGGGNTVSWEDPMAESILLTFSLLETAVSGVLNEFGPWGGVWSLIITSTGNVHFCSFFRQRLFNPKITTGLEIQGHSFIFLVETRSTIHLLTTTFVCLAKCSGYSTNEVGILWWHSRIGLAGQPQPYEIWLGGKVDCSKLQRKKVTLQELLPKECAPTCISLATLSECEHASTCCKATTTNFRQIPRSI